jgi:hypothetical protein
VALGVSGRMNAAFGLRLTFGLAAFLAGAFFATFFTAFFAVFFAAFFGAAFFAVFFVAFFAFFVAIEFSSEDLSATATAFSSEMQERSRWVTAILEETQRITRGEINFSEGNCV